MNITLQYITSFVSVSTNKEVVVVVVFFVLFCKLTTGNYKLHGAESLFRS
jgi:hypothetical protein